VNPGKAEHIVGVFFDLFFDFVEGIALGAPTVFDRATDHSPRVSHEIGDRDDASLVQDLLRFAGGRDIGSLQNQLALHGASILFVDHVRLSSRNKNIAVDRFERIDWHRFSTGKPRDASVFLHMFTKFFHVQSVLVVNRSISIAGSRHDRASLWVHEVAGGVLPHVPKSLDCNPGTF